MIYVIEFLVVFLVVYLINYFLFVRNKLKYSKKDVPTELLYMKKIYNINLKKLNYKNFVYSYALVNTFIISCVYMIVTYLISNFVLKLVIGIVLMILMIIICYGLLARYYLWKEGRDDV